MLSLCAHRAAVALCVTLIALACGSGSALALRNSKGQSTGLSAKANAKAKAQARARAKAKRASRRKFRRVAKLESRRQSIHQESMRACRKPKTDRATAVAVAILLLDAGLRPGNEAAAARGRTASYGALTLERKHVTTTPGGEVRLRFPGKRRRSKRKGVASEPVAWDFTIQNVALARAIDTLLSLPGDRLLRFQDTNGEVTALSQRHVEAEVAPHGVLLKDFRTLRAILL